MGLLDAGKETAHSGALERHSYSYLHYRHSFENIFGAHVAHSAVQLPISLQLTRKHLTSLQCSHAIVAAAISQSVADPTLQLELCTLYVRLLGQRGM